MGNVKLQTRFTILFVIIIVTSLTLYIFWSGYSQRKQAKKEMLEKAYVLSQQLDAVWEFMSINQDRINHDANGEYNFKGLHCSLVGKSIGKLFGSKTDYVTRYVNNTPRNNDDIADSFESIALERFRTDRNIDKIYDIADYGGKKAFRYVIPMKINETCLECHGEPVGELDILGYPKEGWKIGDIAGALSITMPIEIYSESQKINIALEVGFFSFMLLVLILIIYYVTRKLVTAPLNKLKLATADLKNGNFNIDLNIEHIEAQGEIKDLALHLSKVIRELSGLYNNLEKKVEMRTIDLARANNILECQQAQLEEVNKRLREDNQYKSDFLAIMSHELRTPLTSIVAFTEILETNLANTNIKYTPMIQEIKTNSSILLSLINNILDMARIEAGKTELYIESIDFIDIINAVETIIEPLAARKSIALSTSVAKNVPIIEADREKVRRIVENLASNAVKFTPEGGKISIEVTYNNDKNEIIIQVQDNGIGISKDHLNIIFDKFVQGDSSIHRQFSGSGLGLALAKELTELHGGRITLESELAKGSLFTIILPAKKTEQIYENNAG